MELINDPLDLFQHLRQRCILTRDNIVFLQAMLWHSRRKDLHNKFVKFAKKRGNIVHFFAPNDKPVSNQISLHIDINFVMDHEWHRRLQSFIYQLDVPIA